MGHIDLLVASDGQLVGVEAQARHFQSCAYGLLFSRARRGYCLAVRYLNSNLGVKLRKQ